MDIAGAKALKKRLGPHRADENPPDAADVSADAPPVYHYLGVTDQAPEAPPEPQGRSLLRWLGLTSR
jgi:hypothetical protein